MEAFHADELTAQSRAGVHTRSGGIRNFMLEPHRNFFAALPHIFLATSDAEGWPLATLLEGDPGFIDSPDPVTLHVRALPREDDPAAGTLRVGDDVGILGIELATRRRNRANGVVSGLDASGFTVSVKQSFGNCPQYIQRRGMRRTEVAPGRVHAFDRLEDEYAQALIAHADTFFVASRSRADAGATGGADISHRGGRPGFVRVDDDMLSIPDFRGNRFFNTLGNLIGEPRASLLFVDFESGDVLQLQGLVKIDWDAAVAKEYEGAERLWHFAARRGWYRPRAAALRGTFVEYAPTTLRTGTWTATSDSAIPAPRRCETSPRRQPPPAG